jgi:5-formyltetrahydrofolate cyclo-ligase
MSEDLKARKRQLRSELIAARSRLSAEERLARSTRIADRLDALDTLARARVVGLYAALGTEVESSVIAARLRARGARILFPRIAAVERRLDFCACDPAELVRGPLGAAEPPALTPASDLAEVDAFVIPGVGFAEDGTRLGRGGGYYDVTLRQAPRAARIGVAFDAQVVRSLPREPHDVSLDAIVTESRSILLKRDGTI